MTELLGFHSTAGLILAPRNGNLVIIIRSGDRPPFTGIGDDPTALQQDADYP